MVVRLGSVSSVWTVYERPAMAADVPRHGLRFLRRPRPGRHAAVRQQFDQPRVFRARPVDRDSYCETGAMNARDRERYHQLHPAKLLVDWCTAFAAGALLWRRQPMAALAVGFGPSIAVTLIFLSGSVDRALERIRNRPSALAIASQLSADVNVVRFAGLGLSWLGCWFHRIWMVPAGVMVILGGWWLAWRRGVPVN